MRSLTCLMRGRHPVTTTYVLTNCLHDQSVLCTSVDEIISTVSGWLAELGVDTALAEDLGQTVRDGDWPAAHAIAERLSVEIAIAA